MSNIFKRDTDKSNAKDLQPRTIKKGEGIPDNSKTKGGPLEFSSDLIWDDNVTHELNTYRNLNPIALNHEPMLDLNAPRDSEGNYLDKSVNAGQKHYFGGENGAFEGRFSLFNHANAVVNDGQAQLYMNAPLHDSPSVRETIRKNSDCSVKALVQASEENQMGRAVYRYSDFMFCKYLGKISNNYLITLRRFPAPAGDHINYTSPSKKSGENDEKNAHLPDIGRLVTWMGTPGNEMSNILKYDVNLPYEEMQAQIQDSRVDADNGGGPLGALLNMSNPAYQSKALRGAAGGSSVTFMKSMLGPQMGSFLSAPPDTSWAYHRDETKAYGPVDAIARTHIRSGAEKGGIKFEHNITLTFDYELRAFDGINTRAAMLDLLSNVLAVTFSNATYWGGAIHGNGAAQNSIFTNLPIFHMQSPVSLVGITNALFSSGNQILSAFNNGKAINGLGDLINAAMNFGKDFLNMAAAGALNSLGRPQREGLNSLLNFKPTGVWHLMVGNPRHPIMSMGNMILDNCTIEHYGPLGLDDFPTGLKVTITLKHGTPRDNMKIEQMYMNGDYRIYQPLGNQGLKAWEQAEELYDKTYDAKNADDINALSSDTTRYDNNGNIIDVPLVDQETHKIANRSNLLVKYWGTRDPVDILKSCMEAHLGSEPKRTKAEAEADQRAMEEAKKQKKR